MQNILLLFARFGTLITFLFFTTVSFLLIVNYNKTQKAIFINSSNYYANKLDSRTSRWQNYLSLQEVNDSLANHNAELMEHFINFSSVEGMISDSTLQYDLLPAKVIRNTYNLRNNHLTLDIGKKQGVEKDMGVLSEEGILGIVKNVSADYSHVVSVLNSQTRISCTVKPYAYPGNLIWKNLDPKFMTLESIPKHVAISIGDTVVTNGYSTIFPANIEVGTVAEVKTDKGSSNFSIKVELFNNVPNSKRGYVIKNNLALQQKNLENLGNE
ncbi:MAG: rod shape-determining protein MreC [Saprospiraceae bacterium]|jgi:rod shape-determining protein MreC|tara:strand:- start:1338 stop:2147 length:810 start_codon:yes stop_codon:yes gene_type:complete